ncbi:hypothetical protein HNV12_02140 [Methanococcoides sp. SA1]|nr:hypothetical protein [Methanococcoides sp. SA1]
MGYYGARCVVKRGMSLGEADGKLPDIGSGEVLVGLMYCNDWVMAPDVTSKFDYDRFYGDVGVSFRKMELYVVDRNEVRKCLGEGRVLVSRLGE